MRLEKKIYEYYNNKYGKNWLFTVPKHDYIGYIIHLILSISFMIDAVFFGKSEITLSTYIVEMLVFSILIVLASPHFSVLLLILPIIGIWIYDVTLWILIQTKLNINIFCVAELIASIINIVIITLLILRVKKQNTSKELELKVKSKVPIDFDCSHVIFQGNDGKNYLLTTDLDEKFAYGQIYKIKIKNKNISTKALKIQGDNIYKIEKIDASYFELKINEKI